MFNITLNKNNNIILNTISFKGKCSKNKNYNFERTPQTDEFRKTSNMHEENQDSNLKLTNDVKNAINGENNNKLKEYLDNFEQMEIVILRMHKKDDVIQTIQTFIDAAEKENDESITERYINIIHKAICPNTGIGKYVNTKNLENKHFSDNLKQKINDIKKASESN